MRRPVFEFAKLAAATLPIQEPVYEFGSYVVPGQEGMSVRSLFAGKAYVGADFRGGPGVDAVLDLHDIDLPDETAGTVLCFDTLEHVEDPRRAMLEIHRVLKPGGIAAVSSVMNFPIHDYPHDYWRFTPEAFKSILKPFESSFVGHAGEEQFPHTVVGVGFKGAPPPLDSFLSGYEAWRARQDSRLKQLVRRWSPPALIPTLVSLRDRLGGKG